MSGPGGICEAEQVDRCELCGCIAETRPYGPEGQEVCFSCGMKDEKTAEAQMEKHLFGQGVSRNKVRGTAKR